MKRIWMSILISAALAVGAFTGCASAATTSSSAASSSAAVVASSTTATSTSSASSAATTTTTAAVASSSGGALDTSDMFSDRDLQQEADVSDAKTITVTSNEDVTISEEGTYVLSGTAENVTITVNADSSAKVQLVLDGLTITNGDAPAIYVASADKVFVTTASGSTNKLTVTGSFAASSDSDSSVDGVIYAKDDIVLNGTGTLVVNSSDNGIVGKDDVKVTGGTYEITASGHGIQGKDSVAIADGTFNITAGSDAIHSANDEDQSKGYVYIADGTFNLKASSDGIEGDAVVQIDGGTLGINSAEGIEGTYVQINDGSISINATDDGINATTKSSAYSVAIEINGGNVTVDMGQGDTDALDTNGDLIINGGNVTITAQFAFDFDGQGILNGGTVIVNGEQVTELTNSMMGGMGGPGGMGSQGAPSQGSMGDMSSGSRGARG